MSPSSPVSISPAVFPQDLPAVTALLQAYATSLGIDLSFQDFGAELAGLPGKYAPEAGGALLVARERDGDGAGEVVGCVGVRGLAAPTQPQPQSRASSYAEMKRLYTAPSHRGRGIGAQLARAAVAHARRLGYGALRLDTLPSMGAAKALYERLGFRETAAYYETPVEGTVFLEVDLH